MKPNKILWASDSKNASIGMVRACTDARRPNFRRNGQIVIDQTRCDCAPGQREPSCKVSTRLLKD